MALKMGFDFHCDRILAINYANFVWYFGNYLSNTLGIAQKLPKKFGLLALAFYPHASIKKNEIKICFFLVFFGGGGGVGVGGSTIHSRPPVSFFVSSFLSFFFSSSLIKWRSARAPQSHSLGQNQVHSGSAR